MKEFFNIRRMCSIGIVLWGCVDGKDYRVQIYVVVIFINFGDLVVFFIIEFLCVKCLVYGKFLINIC